MTILNAHGALYRTIVADPPWPITWTWRSKPAYTTMRVDEIASLPVEDLAHEDAHLFLWTLDRYVLDGAAAEVCQAWGFEPLGQMLVWSKRNAGLGRVIRPAHELVVIARRGEDARLREISTTSVREWGQVYENGAKVHSAKPDAFYDEVEALSEGPYLELFARRQRLGWDSWGLEARCDVALTEGGHDGH